MIFSSGTRSRSAPCGNDQFGIEALNFPGGGVLASADEVSASGFDEFRDTGLRRDDRLAPFLAPDSGPRTPSGSAAHFAKVAFDGRNPGSPPSIGPTHRPDRARNGSDVGVDIRQGFWSQPQEARTGLQNRTNRLFLIGNSRNYEVGLRAHDLSGVGGPGVGQNYA
jgi:hypothetical protein